MKKIKFITIFLIIISTLYIFGAENEDEAQTLENRSSDNVNDEELRALRNSNRQRNNNNSNQRYYPPSSENNARPSTPEGSNHPDPEERGRQNERRSFRDILNNIERRRRNETSTGQSTNNDLRVPWNDNSQKRKKKKRKYSNIIKVRLSLNHKDILMKKNEDESITIFVRKKKYIESVLLTTATSEFSENRNLSNEYALRSTKYIEENGNIKFYYKGKFLGKKQKLFFLISSKPVYHPVFKKAFKIKIPKYVIYGYKWENFGTLRITEGAKINIRTFACKYANYKKGHADNVIRIDTSLYSGRDFYKPKMKLYKLAETNKYVVAYIQYKDNNKYFKGFYYREGNDTLFKEIFFSNTDQLKDLRGILIVSRFDVINKKIVKFRLYIKKGPDKRFIFVTGEDISGNKPDKPIKLVIPRAGQSLRDVLPNSGDQQPNSQSQQSSNTDNNNENNNSENEQTQNDNAGTNVNQNSNANTNPSANSNNDRRSNLPPSTD